MKSTEPPAALPTVVYGGSFNPIHRGHIALGQYLVGRGLAREVWYMVSPQNPLKPPAGLLPDAARLRLARLAVEGLEGLRASDFEFGLPRPSYTVHTLRALRAALPGRKLALLIGADNWVGFRRWYRWEEILDETVVFVYPRAGYPVDEAALPPGVQLLRAPLFPTSSTAIRQALHSGHDAEAAEWLPPRVYQEIKEKGYYR